MGINLLPAAFHFAEPLWLWGIAALPLVWILYASFYNRGRRSAGKLKDFADEHLLPHLLDEEEKSGGKRPRIWLPLLAWSIIWACGLLAMAGPRWDYTEVKTFTPGRDLVILLDLSKSMDTQDVKPSRTARARQEIEDIVKASKGTNTGLVAFATVPHMITPLSDDTDTLSSLLPYLKPDLVYTQGSYLVPALEMAGEMLKTESGNDKNVLIISDGGFDDGDTGILKAEESLRSQGVGIDVMGIGTTEGAPIPDAGGGYIRKNGSLVFSRLELDRLKRLARDGGGIYVTASYLDDDTKSLMSEIENASAVKRDAKKNARFWEERYYVFLIPFALLLLPWFRRNAVFPAIIAAFIVMQVTQAHAFDWDSLYLNNDQQGAKYMQEGKYDSAVQKFDDPYRRGVAEYKAGKYDAAAKSFQKADRQGIKTDALYNLGNAQLMSGKIEDAIKSYQDVLKTNPDNADAKHNLEIAKKLLEQKQKQQNQQQQNQQQQNKQQQNKQHNQQNQQQNQNQQGKQDQNKNGEQQNQNDRKQEASKNGSKDQKNEQDKKDQNSSGGQNDQQKAQNEKEAGQNGDNQEKENKQQDKNESAQAEKQKVQKENDKQKNEEARSGEQKEQNGQEQKQENAGQRDANKDIGNNQLENNQLAQQKTARDLKDIDANQWLDRIQNDPDLFLRNKFYIESQRKGAKQGENPW